MEIVDISKSPSYEDEWREFLPGDVPAAFGAPWFMAYAAVDRGSFCGILIAEKNEKGTVKSPKVDYTILWVYVKEALRGNGIGNELISHFVANSPNAVKFICDVEASNHVFINMMEDCGMTFSDEIAMVDLTAKDMSENRLFDGKASNIEGMTFFDDLDPWDLKVYLMWIEEHLLFKHTMDIKDYDTHMSCVIIQNDKPVGFYLIKRYPRGVMEPEFMQTTGGAEMVVKLLRAINVRAVGYLPPDTRVRLMIKQKQNVALYDKLFSRFEKVNVRHGEISV